MRWLAWPLSGPIVFGLGVVCGATLVAGAVLVVGLGSESPDEAKAVAALDGMSTSELGGELMRRVGATFVSDSRTQYPLASGPTFYDIPKPWGKWACRVDKYEFTADLVKGRPSRTPFLWDPMKVERRYGIWSKPTGPKPTPQQHLDACRAFRDFDHLLVEKTILSASRAYYVIDVVKDAIAADQIDFKLTCAGAKWPCDTARKLQDIDLRMLGHVKTTSDRWERELGYALRTDEITIAGPKDERYNYVVTVDSKQVFGLHSVDEALVLAVDVKEELQPFTPTAP